MCCSCKPPSSSLWDKFKARQERFIKLLDEAARPVAKEIHEYAKEDAKAIASKISKQNHSGSGGDTPPTASSERREWKDIDAVVDAE
jgi:hypothetical protein